MPDPIPLLTRAAAARATASARHGTGAVVSLAALLRWSPPEFLPLRVARDILDAGGNDAARPIWAARWHGLAALLGKRGIKGRAADGTMADWRAAVRQAGIAEKARRAALVREQLAFFADLKNAVSDDVG